jgi:hypothetical protein
MWVAGYKSRSIIKITAQYNVPDDLLVFYQPVIEQQLSQNNIALYFAAVKLQAIFYSNF